jgi:competence protein ComEC
VANPAVKDNDRSCVIRVDAACGSVLLSADVERSSELQLLTQPLKADILLVPHHGSKTSSSRPFIEAVAPSVALVSAGYRNRFGHPRADVLQRYQERGTQIIRSDMDGAVALRCDSSGWHSTTQRAMARRYWH